MISLKRYALSAAVIVLVVALGGGKIVGASDSHYTVYENKEFNFSLLYPSDWTYFEDMMGTAFSVLPAFEHEEQLFVENMNVVVGDLGNLRPTLEDYHLLSLAQLKLQIENFELVSAEDAVLAGHSSKLIVFTGTIEELQLQWMLGYFLADGRAYVLTFTAEQDKFDSYLPVGISIFDSFELN